MQRIKWTFTEQQIIPLLFSIGFEVVDVLLFKRLFVTLTAQSLQVNQSAFHLLKVPFQMC